jgi:hypothetical protein
VRARIRTFLLPPTLFIPTKRTPPTHIPKVGVPSHRIKWGYPLLHVSGGWGSPNQDPLRGVEGVARSRMWGMPLLSASGGTPSFCTRSGGCRDEASVGARKRARGGGTRLLVHGGRGVLRTQDPLRGGQVGT